MNKTYLILTWIIGWLAAESALGHATIWPQEAAVGAYEKYTIRIPNEKESPTIRVEAAFPEELAAYFFSAVPGWTIEREQDSNGRTVRAVWTGGSIGPHEFTEFSLLARNPDTGGTLVWEVIQFHADGTQSAWVGEPDSPNPAPLTTVR
jgi:uncharacterized protein YcnI